MTVDGTIAVTGFASGDVPDAGDCVEITRTDGAEGTYCLPGESTGGESGAPSSSPPSSSAPPVTAVPGAPQFLAATEGTKALSLSWIAPDNDGGAAITDYVIEYKATADSTWTVAEDGTSSSTSFTLNVTNAGTKYDVRVSAVNSAGAGSSVSVSNKQPIPAIGDNVYGGYYAGMIDTTGSGGSRYLVIAGPKSLEKSGASFVWRASNSSNVPSATLNSWDGLTATAAMAAVGGLTYPAAEYAYSRSFSSTDGGSRWYLPAKDEFELLYRNLKPTTATNSTLYGPAGGNPSSSPVGATYTSTAPGQTGVSLFREGNSQALSGWYWTSTAFIEPGFTTVSGAWLQMVDGFTGGGSSRAGAQTGTQQNDTDMVLRPVRRVTF